MRQNNEINSMYERKSPSQIIHRIYVGIKSEWKRAFFAVLGFGFAAHAMKLLNFLPNWDTFMYYYYPGNNMIHQGRHTQMLACAPSSFCDAPWITGILCLLYIWITVVAIIEVLEIKKNYVIWIAGLVVTFPTITSGFAYMYMADAFCVALMCSSLAVWITLKKKHGFWLGALILAFGMGSYQGFLSFAIGLCVVWIMKQVLKEDISWKDVGKQVGKYFLMGVLSLIFYYVSLQVFVFVQGVILTGHQGMGSMRMPTVIQVITAIKKSYIDFIYFYIESVRKPTLYQCANIVVGISLFVYAVKVLKRNKVYKNPLQLLTFIGCILVYPCISFIYYFVTDDIIYHALMEMSLSLIYVFVFVLLEEWNRADTTETDRSARVIRSWVSIIPFVAIAVLIYNAILVSNISYRIMNESYEKTVSLMTRVVDRMEQEDGFEEVTHIAIIGNVPNSSMSQAELHPTIVGVTEGYIISHQMHIIAMLDEYYHIPLIGMTEEELYEAMTMEQQQNMGIWPEEDSVKIIDDTIVIRFE